MAAIDLMLVLGDASTRLARLPASATRDDINAGMSFTMLRGVEPLLAGAIERTLLSERVTALARNGPSIGGPAKSALARAAATLSRL